MSESLSGQLALVTGAGRGLGRACAEGLADAGARVIATARTAFRAEEPQASVPALLAVLLVDRLIGA